MSFSSSTPILVGIWKICAVHVLYWLSLGIFCNENSDLRQFLALRAQRISYESQTLKGEAMYDFEVPKEEVDSGSQAFQKTRSKPLLASGLFISVGMGT